MRPLLGWFEVVRYAALAVCLAASLGSGGCAEVVDDDDEDEDEETFSADGEIDPEDECALGATIPCDNFEGIQICMETPEGNRWMECEEWDVSGGDTPLVLSFDGAAVQFLTDARGTFDLSGQARSVPQDWPSPVTPWLALDRNGNGIVDDGGELFGSATVLSDGRRAANGFVALRELDVDGDGAITEQDPAWSRLLVWSDDGADRVSAGGEMVSVAAKGLLAIGVQDWMSPRCDSRRNCEMERASLRFRGGDGQEQLGAIVDVHLPRR